MGHAPRGGGTTGSGGGGGGASLFATARSSPAAAASQAAADARDLFPGVAMASSTGNGAEETSITLLKTLVSHLRSLPVVRFPSTAPGDRRASVAAVLRVQPRPNSSARPVKDVESFLAEDWVRSGTCQLLFVQRALNPRDPWSGDVAFPGGKRDPEDESDQVVAERETKEEIGLDLTLPNFALLGELDEREVKSFGGEKWLTLSCFVYLQLGPTTPDITLQLSEISAAFWVPLTLLHDLVISDDHMSHERWHLRTYALSSLVIPQRARPRRDRPEPSALQRVARTVFAWTAKIVLAGFGSVSFGGIRLPVEDDEWVESPGAADEAVIVPPEMSGSSTRDASDEEDSVVVKGRAESGSVPPSEGGLGDSQWIDLSADAAFGKKSLLARHPPHSEPVLWGLTLWMASDLADLLFSPNEVPHVPLATKSRAIFSSWDVNIVLNLVHPQGTKQVRKPMPGFNRKDESGAGEPVSVEGEGIGEIRDPNKERVSFGTALRVSILCALVLRSAIAFVAISKLRRLILTRLLA
ncbi:hypothetical protein DFJ74DRAFT_429060 [Hyaloraphidium curvatum]|nr:hypothetical protein DFJ74DRAFT_429060 [Hyaloraphidium curvatum]